ncbi:LacI family transcriptional regulator [Alphaproteobacteria bacterium]|nr:LacI family transcriptional regulator [Alphaproteobacteria bacterium]
MDIDDIKNMEEFAHIVGISRPTISKYFNDAESVRQTTRLKIEEALKKYNYRPNIYAINQNRKLTKNIGIIVPFLADPFFAEIARFIERRILSLGFTPSLFSAHGDPEIEKTILDTLRSLRPAGVLLAPLGRASDKRYIKDFCRDVPTILFDSNIEGMGEAFVGSDNYSFVSQTVEYLSRTGTPPTFFEMRNPANPNANKRRNSYIAMMEKLELEANFIQVDGNGWAFEEIGRAGALEILKQDALPTNTILCSNDRLAIGFLSACHKLGIQVGRDENSEIRVASHDDHPYSKFTCPSLTTAAHDYESVASYAVETLFKLIEEGGHLKNRNEKLFSARLIMRDSA